MRDYIPYFYYQDIGNFTYSIDMITLQGFGNCPNFEKFVKDNSIPYFDSGDSKRKNKYFNIYKFINFGMSNGESINVDIGEIVGRDILNHDFYDEHAETWKKYSNGLVNAPMWKIRFNPNKRYKDPYFDKLVALLTEWSTNNSGMLYLTKIDLACDFDGITSNVLVKSRKSSGRIDTTYYFGKSGRDGYCKIYDKGKELGLEKDRVVRIEYTFVAPFNIKFDSMLLLSEPLEISNNTDLLLRYHWILTHNGYYDTHISDLRTENFRGLEKAKWCEHLTLDFTPFDKLVQCYCDLFHCTIACQDSENLFSNLGLEVEYE